MPIEDRLNLQQQVLEVLETRRRRSYRGPVVMQMRLATTDRTPAHVHTIAKNILDLLGRPLLELTTSRKGLLYFDDVQVHALSVSCEHGAENPEIHVQVQSLGDFRDDLGLALHVLNQGGNEECDNADVEDEFNNHGDLLADRGFLRAQIGDEAFKTLLDTTRRDAQRRLLGHAKLRPEVIIKPPPTPNHALHDLDNVMRTYLVPKVTELLEPPSDIAWTFDRSVIARHDGDHGSWLHNRLEKLPRSARVGLIRYEAWRIPRVPGDTSPGFVSAAVVSDDFGYEDSISRIARLLNQWAERVN